MKRKLIFLNLAIAGLTIAAGWKLREEWNADRARAEALRRQQVKAPPPPVTPAIPKPDPFAGATYVDVAQKMLFAKDRSPNIIVDPPKPVPVKKMPPLPLIYGVMGLPSGMTAMMAEKPEAGNHGVHVGETIGEFKLLAISQKQITLEWDGQKIEKSLDQMMDEAREKAPPPAQNAAAPAAAPQVPAGPPGAAKPGKDIGGNIRACDPTDTSPGGTLADGYKKIRTITPFGEHCEWAPAQ